MDTAPAMIWVAGPDKGCIWFNRPWLDFTGRRLDEEIGEGWTEGVHPGDLDRCLRVYSEGFDARQGFRMQYRLRRRDGAWRWVDDTGSPRYDAQGAFLGYVGSCVDIHEHKEAEEELNRLRAGLEAEIGEASRELEDEALGRSRAEQALRYSVSQLATLVQGIKDYAIYMIDREGRVSSWNVGAERIKGYRAEEIEGRHFSTFYTEEEREAGVPERALRTAAEEGKFTAEGWRVRKDGSRFWANVLIDPIHDDDGGLVGFAKITRDVTDQRVAQEQLERARESLQQAQKMEAVGQLTGGVAHDFNNLLMVILGNLEVVQRRIDGQDGPDPRLARAVGNAMSGAKRAATLTQRLLAFARRQPLDFKPLDVNKFIAGEVDFLQRTLGETIEVEAVGGGGLWGVEVDAAQLESALLNLAINARDAMPEGGKLTIETSNAFLDEDYCEAHAEVQPGQYVLIAVTDNGRGMPAEIRDRVFEPFFSTKEVGHGTGLGLSQVYGFIKQSGGHIKVYSEPGEGTTVRIYLPRIAGQGAAHEREQAAVPLPGEDGETVLVVEDDEGVRDYLVDLLGDLGYRVLMADGAEAAIPILERAGERVDLLLTDVVLPGRNGRELARRAQDLRPGLRVLFMTGYSRNAVVHQGRLDADVELIQKPFTQSQIASRIRSLLDGPTGREG